MEDAGIEPATFRMQSGRSANWAKPPRHSTFCHQIYTTLQQYIYKTPSTKYTSLFPFTALNSAHTDTYHRYVKLYHHLIHFHSNILQPWGSSTLCTTITQLQDHVVYYHISSYVITSIHTLLYTYIICLCIYVHITSLSHIYKPVTYHCQPWVTFWYYPLWRLTKQIVQLLSMVLEVRQ